MKEKWTPHIIAATALVVFIVLGLACVTAPKAKPPKGIVYDSSIPAEQTASLLIPPGNIEVIEFDGKTLKPKWYQPSLLDPGMLVKIPSGKHEICFHYYGGEFGATMKNIRLKIDTVSGRTYGLFPILTNYSRGMTRISETVLFTTYELMFSKTVTIPQREPGPNEQRLFIQLVKGNGALYVLDKGTPEERTLYFSSLSDDTHIIIPKGEHTIDVALTPGHIASFGTNFEPDGVPQRDFTASSEPVRYSVELIYSGSGKNTKTTYKLIQK
jgi:hypothetical protein